MGACLGIPALTGYHAVATAAAWAGSTLLITGGAGQVALYAIQFAKARGAVVIATVSSEKKAEIARMAGADHVIDYRREDVAGTVMDLTDNGGVDAVIEVDLAANATLLPRVLRPRGTAVVYGTSKLDAQLPLQAFLTSQLALEFIFVYELTPEARSEAITAVSQMLEDHRLRHFCLTVLFAAESAPCSRSLSFDCGGIPHLDTVLFLRNPSSQAALDNGLGTPRRRR